LGKRTGFSGQIAALALLCLLLFSGCAVTDGNGYVPFFARLRNVGDAAVGEAVEAFDVQAVPILEAGLAEYWYPQHLATAVIAVDRARTGAEITGWRDLAAAGEIIGFDNTNHPMLMAAMAYGLEKASGRTGGNFTLRETARLLAGLNAMGLLAFGSPDMPVVVCYDYQAAALGLEIIVPEEGTLTYVKGLLSSRPLDAPSDTGLTGTFTDYDHLNTVCRDAGRVMRRTILRSRLYTSADGGEHQLFAVLYIILVTIWTAAMIRRAMQKSVRLAFLLVGILLLGWILTRALKYQMPYGILNRHFWYGYYLFQLALPPVLLWLAWAIDRSPLIGGGGSPIGQRGDKAKPPKWFALPAAVSGALVALVLTNDLHNWVFRLDLGNPSWASEYGYGPGYYVVLAYSAVIVLAAILLLLLKAWRVPRKGSFLFPIAFGALLLAYGLAYIARVPLAQESDVTMVTGLLTLLFMETAICAGMIPVNSKYRQLFAHSTLAMQIVGSGGETVLSSSLPSKPAKKKEEDTLLFAAPIAGGNVLWQEDISALNRLHREVEAQARKLEVANAMLAEEEKIKRAVEEESARTQILAQMESEIAGGVAKLSAMVENHGSTAGIMLLLCYIKRRCNLFFRGRELQLLPAEELAMYIDELAELACHADVRIVTAFQIQTPVELRRATLFYDFFYSVVELATTSPRKARGFAGTPGEGSGMLACLGSGQGRIAMRLLASRDMRPFQAEGSLAAAAEAAGGAIAVKDLDDAVGIFLSFPEGGGAVG